MGFHMGLLSGRPIIPTGFPDAPNIQHQHFMAFDFNEARAIIEAAKQQGLIRPPGSPDPAPKAPSAQSSSAETENLPDWLKKEIREPSAKKSEGTAQD